MTTFVNEGAREQLVEADLKPGSHPVGLKSPDAAWAAVQQILDGRGNAVDLVGLTKQLDAEHLATLKSQLGKAAAVISGDVTLEVGEIVGASAGASLKAAATSRVHPTSERLLRTLSQLDASVLDDIEPAVLSGFVKPFRTKSFLLVMPKIGGSIGDLEQHPELLKWFVDSTPPGIVAQLMGLGGTKELGAVLDRLGLWKPWIGHVSIALPRYELLANGSADPDVKRRLLAPFGSRTTTDGAGQAHVASPEPDGIDTIDRAIVTGASKARLLEAIGAAGGMYMGQEPAVIAALNRVGATADEVLALATSFANEPGVEWLKLLLSSPGVTAQHVKFYVGRFPIEISELDEPTVRTLRARAGRSLHLYELVTMRDTAEHGMVVGSEPLREWFFEDARPADLLWFCSSQGELATKATRIVAARHPDWKWVRELTGTEDVVQLRALALACNDAPTTKFIREELLHDPTGVAHFDHGEISTKSYEGERDRLRFAVALHDPDAVMARLADLDDAERLAFGKNAAAVADLVQNAKLDEFQFARAADLVDLDFRQSLALCPSGVAIINHLRTRPPAEEAVALADAKLVARAATDIVADLFVVFPSLANRAVLAKALSNNSDLLRFLLVGSDPHRVLDLLAVDSVAKPALEIFAEDASLVRLLPAREHMSAAARGLVDRLVRTPGLDADVAETVDHVRNDNSVDDRVLGADTDEKAAVARGAAMHELDQTESLVAAIDKLLAGDVGRDPAALTGVLSSHQAQVPALLDDSAQWKRVSVLAARLRLSPAVACPFIAPELLVQMTNALRWYFELADRSALLHLVTNASVAGHVAQYLSADSPSARAWLEALPRGAALVDHERRALDLIEAATPNGDVLRTLFQVRFNVEPPAASSPDGKQPSTFGAGDIDSLYRIVSRLPPSHVNQERIKSIASEKISMSGADGLWRPDRVIVVGEKEHEGREKSEFHSDDLEKPIEGEPPLSERTASAYAEWMTVDEVKRAFGYDDAGIKARVESKEFLVQSLAGTTYYKAKPVPIDTFTQIVLHEIGHSIDDILGNHTKPVYEFAGWHEFNDDQFDAWAGEMGGWETVAAADKPKIKQAWIDAARSNSGVHNLVSADHPAMAERYADVGIVRAGRENRTFSAWYPAILNGRMFVAGSYQGRWYSVNAAIVPSAPSHYSLYAPQEYFAESYVEYYRGVDGTPGSEKRKGGMLASPVKKFFDEKVDALKYDPRRFEKHDDDS